MRYENEIKNFGDREIEQQTTLKSKHGVQNYEQLVRQHSARNPFRDPEFGFDNGSIGNASKLFDSARPGSMYNKWKQDGWNGSFEWMRIKDIIAHGVGGSDLRGNETIKFVSGTWHDTAHRMDIRQGILGDCTFVASLATIACEEELIKKVAPEDNKNNVEAGIYHFRFWFQGFWIDIVVDDYLPIVKLQGGRTINLIGSNFVKIGNEASIWVPLAEKAYAKLQGSYENISNGQSINTLENLTGQMVENKFFHKPDTPIPRDFFQFLEETFGNRSLMVLSSKNEVQGLRSGHAYSITNVAAVKTNRGETVKLVRIRNPWGTTEWKGAWSDSDPKWNGVSDTTKRQLGVTSQDDGEFWMTYDDMIKFFNSAAICYGAGSREVNCPGARLAYEAYNGEWNRNMGTTGGCYGGHEHENPQYAIDVDGFTHGGTCVIYIQIGLKVPIKTDAPKLCMGFKIFKALGGQEPPYKQYFFDDPHESQDITDLTLDKKKSTYTWNRLELQEYRVSPGRYVIVPSTFEQGAEGRFYLRVMYSKRQ